jgi:hypothetical protein
MTINIPDDLYPRLSSNAIKLYGYYQHCEQPITESSKLAAPKIGMGYEAINTARGELEFFGLIQVTRPAKNGLSILLINC